MQSIVEDMTDSLLEALGQGITLQDIGDKITGGILYGEGFPELDELLPNYENSPLHGLLDQTADNLWEAIKDWTKDFSEDLGALPSSLREMMQEAMSVDVFTFFSDPLVLDLNGDGLGLTSVTSSHAYFDLWDTGFANLTGWVGGGDGFLVQDVNANGRIDDITEMFGDASQSAFAELATLDSNSDGKITSADAQWNSLKVWIDADGDGYTDAGELHTLSALNISDVSLATTASGSFINGNEVVQTATFKQNGVDKTVGEILFSFDPTNTVFADENFAGLNWEALTLPALRGAGTVADTARLAIFPSR